MFFWVAANALFRVLCSPHSSLKVPVKLPALSIGSTAPLPVAVQYAGIARMKNVAATFAVPGRESTSARIFHDQSKIAGDPWKSRSFCFCCGLYDKFLMELAATPRYK